MLIASALWTAACDEMYPEVIIVNHTGEHILLKDISFNGCTWQGVIAFDEATASQYCLPGKDRIHLKKLDAHAYCSAQAADGMLDDVCLCHSDTDNTDTDDDDSPAVDEGLVNEEPNWFNYQTVSVHEVDYGQFRRFEITLNNLEQDFSVPGPYGH